MSKLVPNMYKKSIFDIDYEKLQKDKKISILLFDFDNTIIAHKNYQVDKKTKDLFKKLNKRFIVYVVSNSINSGKLSQICGELNVPFVGGSMKPLKRGFKKLNFKTKNDNIAIIGDQIFTDVLGGNKMNYFTILVDPIDENTEIIFTRINRKLENLITKHVRKEGYYD